MIIFPTKNSQVQVIFAKSEENLSMQNRNYINNLKQNLKTGKGLFNTALSYMPEMHMSLPKSVSSEMVENGSFNNTGKYSYCGPGTKVQKRVLEGYQGVNNLDKACKEHDLFYSKNKTTKLRNIADDELAAKASQLVLNPSIPQYEKNDAKLVTGIMAAKSRFGMGLKKKSVFTKNLEKLYYDPKTGYSGVENLARKSGLNRSQVEKWLTQQNVYSLHKPIKHRFKTRRVIVSKIDDQWQADLVDMQKYKTYNKNYNYILTVIDIFSKFAWALPIKNKTGDNITRAFEKLFKDRIPSKIHTDKGLEFINKSTQNLFKRKNIHWFATENETKAQVVERFNRTLKSKMFKYFTANNTKTWIDIIDDLVYNYNNSYHRSIKMSPSEGSLKKNSKVVYNNLFPKTDKVSMKPKFSVGDRVRISKKRKDFTKGYLPNFTEEVFIVDKVLETAPPTYVLKDLNSETIKGSFYKEELSKYDSELYEIEKVIKKQRGKLLVKWKGYDKPSWISEKSLHYV